MISNIRVGFSTTDSLLSRLIRKLTKQSVSHNFFVVTMFGVDMVVEASFFGLRATPLVRVQANKHEQIIILTPQYDLTAGFTRLLYHLGEAYDFNGLLGMAWVMLGRWFGKKWRNPVRSVSEMFCSEAIARAMVWSNYPGYVDVDPNSVAPGDLLLFFKEEEKTRAYAL